MTGDGCIREVTKCLDAWTRANSSKCMHMVITLYTFPYPPHTVGPFNGQGLPQDYASVGTIRDHSGAEVPQFYTNGAGLVGEEGLDPRLRNVLMRCLALIPAHRPGLVELQAWASDAETNLGFLGDIGGDLTSTELADKFICRPRSVSISSTRPDIPNAVLTIYCDMIASARHNSGAQLKKVSWKAFPSAWDSGSQIFNTKDVSHV